jgi:SAM-dependent methyltransferase
MVEHTHARSFGTVASAYDRHRPGYPAPAVEWAAGNPPPGRVVDLGAGTGILTRVLLELGYTAVPVEPDEGMRAQLALATPGTTALAGAAEDIPVADGSIDAVLSAQAYHWFDREPAHAEAARVLRPGGTLAAIWNDRDPAVGWTAALTAISDEIGGGRTGGEGDGVDSFGVEFGPVERAEFRHSTWHTPDSLVALMATRSYYLTAAPDDRRAMDAAVRELTASHPDLAGRDRFELPYRTTCYRARRR